MDREVELPQSNPSKKLHHSIAAVSDSLRHVQAAFKRQRPIGQMPSNVCRARRVLVPQKDSIKSLQRGLEELGNAASKQDNAAHDMIYQAGPEDSSTAPVSITETMTSTTTAPDENVGNFGLQTDEVETVPDRRNGCLDCGSDSGISSSNAAFQRDLIDGPKKIHFSSVSNARSACPEPPPQRGSDQAAADTRTDNLSSHMTYLALSESECSLNDRVGKRSMSSQDFKQQDYQHTEMSNMSTRSGGTCLLSKTNELVHDRHFTGFLGKDTTHPMTQSSVAGSSCITTTNIHSSSAPILNSTTYNPHSHRDSWSLMGTKHLEDFSSNQEPIIQGGLALPSCPSFQSIHTTLARQTAVSTQVSSSAPDTSMGGVQDHSLSKGQGPIIKEIDGLPDGRLGHPRAVYFDEKSSKGKGYSDEVSDIQSQAPPTKNKSSNANLEPSQSSKSGKDTGGRDLSAPRKKNNDSNMFPKVNGKRYQKLGKIGSGGSSEVHKVISSDCTIYALKSIKLRGRDYSTAYGFCQEIEYLNKLKGKNNIIQLFDSEVTDKTLLNEVMNGAMTINDGKIKDDGFIYMVLEYGEIDLAHMLSQKWKGMDSSSSRIDENWLRFYWQQMLQAVNTIHEERIVHSDLKPANFLLVRGSLKLIDFGIAKAIMSDTTNIQRDSQVGTLNYMSPEAFMWNEHDANGNTIKCGRPSDIWSLGCILYQMVYGRTPFAEYKTFWAKFKAITDRNHEIKYDPVPNPWLLDLMKKCLAWDRNERWRIPQLLQHPFLVPPIPLQLPPSRDQHCKLLMQMAEAYENAPEVSTIFLQLQKQLENFKNTGT
ncbi:serine/threonine-protein kinase MPS1-like [Magnolia sinica]|uniref:serine/threonine-protein kinase MPS1-like n=1 Tax=Magnolia sinica TaxID=86752 RepID=UPI0026587977|nr:serine/threonine-protein kinase MPS1-like [Magnolia sinica]